jgi:hypothetical protein
LTLRPQRLINKATYYCQSPHKSIPAAPLIELQVISFTMIAQMATERAKS